MKDRIDVSLDRLLHVQKAIVEIEIFTRSSNLNDFLNNSFLSSAVLYQFSVIGEAIIHVDSFLLEKYKYPWFKVRSFRNLISHEYFNIKLDAVWEIVQKDLPNLKKVIEIILKEEF